MGFLWRSCAVAWKSAVSDEARLTASLFDIGKLTKFSIICSIPQGMSYALQVTIHPPLEAVPSYIAHCSGSVAVFDKGASWG